MKNTYFTLMMLSILLLLSSNSIANERKYYLITYQEDEEEESASYKQIRYFAKHGIDFDWNEKEQQQKLTLYSRQECKEKIKDEIIDTRAAVYKIPEFTYVNGASYKYKEYYTRYFCVEDSNITQDMYRYDQYIHFFAFRLTREFFEKHTGAGVDLNFTETDFNSYTIYPLDSNQEQAKKITKELDNELYEMTKKQKTSYSCINPDKLTRVETIICFNKDLANLDLKLNKLYKAVIAKYNDKSDVQQNIRDSQLLWLDSRSRNGIKIQSLKNTYTTRIDYLGCVVNEDDYLSCEDLNLKKNDLKLDK